MHPLTCYADEISLCHAKIEKISQKNFCHDQQRWGGGHFWILWGGHSCYEGGHRPHGGGGSPSLPPLAKTLPGMAVFGRSAAVSPAFKKQFYKELQTPFLIENNNKNNRTIEKTIEN